MKYFLIAFLSLFIAASVSAQGSFPGIPRGLFNYLTVNNGLTIFGVSTGTSTDSIMTIVNGVPRKIVYTTFAPSSGSLNYIQNQTSVTQTGGFKLSGAGILNALYVGGSGSYIQMDNGRSIYWYNIQGTNIISGMSMNNSNIIGIYNNAVTTDSAGNVHANGSISSGTGGMTTLLLKEGSTAATIAAGTGAGTSPTISMQGGSLGGLISVTTGTSPTASAVVVTITLPTAYANAGYVTLTPATASASALSGNAQVYIPASNGTTFTISVGSTALAASTNYQWTYHVNGW